MERYSKSLKSEISPPFTQVRPSGGRPRPPRHGLRRRRLGRPPLLRGRLLPARLPASSRDALPSLLGGVEAGQRVQVRLLHRGVRPRAEELQDLLGVQRLRGVGREGRGEARMCFYINIRHRKAYFVVEIVFLVIFLLCPRSTMHLIEGSVIEVERKQPYLAICRAGSYFYHALFLHNLCEIQVCDRPENDCSRRISVRDFATIRCIRFTEVSHRLNEYLVSLGLGRIGFGMDCPIFFIL